MRDDNESLGLFEPLMIPESCNRRRVLNDLALELARRSEGFRRSLPPSLATALAQLVRSMNCYYSNLIEGHHTHPINIDRALNDDYSKDYRQRNLQLEAKAHITVQKWIDEGGLEGRHPVALDAILDIHKRFCELLPAALLVVEDPKTGEPTDVIPGKLRERDVAVGRHVAISPASVPRFMERLHKAYDRKGRIEAILSAACAHHRMLWVHPFLDGNGRVARLMSYAMLRNALDTQGLWSVARGLARQEKTYKAHLAACDLPRRNDLDGRGALSEHALADFTEFFLKTCIDQIDFIESLMKPDRLRERIMIWAQERIRADELPPKSDIVLKSILYQGEIARGEIAPMLGMSERTARRITSALIGISALSSDSTRAPLKLAFPAKFADRWMPGLFPEE